MSFSAKALYVEDNLADFKLLNRQLQNAQVALELCHANSLAEANQLLAQNRFDVVLLDLSLPDAHGFEAIQFFRHRDITLPIVVLTGNTDTRQGKRAITAGAQDYLVKGNFDAAHLARVCMYAIERRKISNQLEQLNRTLAQTVDDLQREKLLVEQKNRQIQSLAGTLIHELKSPVMAINALTELLLADKNKLTVPQIKYLKQIEYSSTSLLDNILSVIEATKSASGDFRMTLETETPYYTLNSSIDQYIVEALQQDIIIEANYGKDIAPVKLDKRLFSNVLSNLLSANLLLTKQSTRIQIAAEAQAPYLQIIIRNKGLKTNEIDLQHAEVSAKLGTAQKLMEAMEGKLTIAPDGKGTQFCLALALA